MKTNFETCTPMPATKYLVAPNINIFGHVHALLRPMLFCRILMVDAVQARTRIEYKFKLNLTIMSVAMLNLSVSSTVHRSVRD